MGRELPKARDLLQLLFARLLDRIPTLEKCLGAGQRGPFISFTVNFVVSSAMWHTDRLQWTAEFFFNGEPPGAWTIGSGSPKFNLLSTSQGHSSWVKRGTSGIFF